jgi:hypothetical protein
MNCPACARRTPSARGTCLYCSAVLPVTKIEAAPPQRTIDNFERAFNTILDSQRKPGDDLAEAALASALKIELAEAQAFVRAGKRVPLARSQTRQEAELIASLVRTCGLEAFVIADEALRLDSELIRARRIIQSGAALEVRHPGGTTIVPLSELRLLVVGALHNTRVDYTEGVTASRGQSNNVLDSSEYRSEETLLDVYATGFDQSFRIKSDAFDYSGLVKPLSFRAEMNFQAALSALRSAAPHARVDDDFVGMKKLLARAWPERSKTEARGVRRAGLAYRPVAQSSVVSDNRDQFDRYSRLMFLTEE